MNFSLYSYNYDCTSEVKEKQRWVINESLIKYDKYKSSQNEEIWFHKIETFSILIFKIFQQTFIWMCLSVRVSRPQNSLLYIAIIDQKGVFLGQNHLYFASKPI